MSLKDDLAKLEQQQAELETQRKNLLSKARDEALNKASAALKELAELGYNYKLVEDSGTRVGNGRSATGRRTGIRDQVLAIVQAGEGLAPAAIIKAIGDETKSGKQAVANALSALKKAGHVLADGGLYKVK